MSTFGVPSSTISEFSDYEIRNDESLVGLYGYSDDDSGIRSLGVILMRDDCELTVKNSPEEVAEGV